MRRFAVMGGVLVALLSGAQIAAASTPVLPEGGRVLVLLAPRLTWERARDIPALMRLAREGAAGSLAPRTVGSVTGPGSAYASIAAGNRADVPPEWEDDAEDRDESTVVHARIRQIRARNDDLHYAAAVGRSNDLLRAGGFTVAVVGNADTARPRRGVVLAGAGADGIARGTVSTALLAPDARAPFGRRLDPAAVLAAIDDADADVQFVELSDLERFDRLAPAEQQRAWPGVARATDDLVSTVLARADPTRDLVIAVGAVPPRAPQQELGYFAMRGPGVPPGAATSATTRKAAYVTLPDIAPTILASLGLRSDHTMTGTPIASDGTGAADPADMVEANIDARYRNRARGPVIGVFLALASLAAALGLASAGRGSARARAHLAWVGPAVMAFPAVELLSGVTPLHHLGTGAGTAVVTAASLLAGAAAAVLRRTHPRAPLVAIAGLVYAVVAVDVVAGAPMQLDRVFGFSSVVAGRFVGLGNQAFAMLIAAVIVLTTLAIRSIVASIGLFAATVVLIGHPSLGSDVGGVLASIPAFAVIVVLSRGRKVRPLPILASCVAAGLALGVFAAIDLQRPPEERTHLARFVSSDRAEILTTIGRKAFAAVRSVARVEWSLLLIAMLVVVALLRTRGGRPVVTARGARTCLAGALTAGVLGWAMNGSGVVVTAIVMVFVTPALALLDAEPDPSLSGADAGARELPS